MTKPTGRPRGRPPKSDALKTVLSQLRPAISKEARTRAEAAAETAKIQADERATKQADIWASIQSDQVDKMLPMDIFRFLAKLAFAAKDEDQLHKVARDWGPYEHAKKTDGPILTPDELRILGNLARAETSRRGYDGPAAPGHSEGAFPN